MDARQLANEEPSLPIQGSIYRDDLDRSFIVLSMNERYAVVEFAEGSVKRITLSEWYELNPTPALC